MKDELEPSPFRALRGGSWGNLARFARAAYRDAFGPSNRGGDLGLRFVRRCS